MRPILRPRGLLATLANLKGCAPCHIQWRTFRRVGWTFIELMLVVAIFGTLVTIVTPRLRQYIDKANVARAIGDIEAIQADLAGHEFTGGKLPASLGDIDRGDILDPWGNPYQYLNFALAAKDQNWGGSEGGTGKPRKDRFLVPLNSSYDLYSMGKDGETDEDLQADKSQDDIVRANDGSFIGLASKY